MGCNIGKTSLIGPCGNGTEGVTFGRSPLPVPSVVIAKADLCYGFTKLSSLDELLFLSHVTQVAALHGASKYISSSLYLNRNMPPIGRELWVQLVHHQTIRLLHYNLPGLMQESLTDLNRLQIISAGSRAPTERSNRERCSDRQCVWAAAH